MLAGLPAERSWVVLGSRGGLLLTAGAGARNLVPSVTNRLDDVTSILDVLGILGHVGLDQLLDDPVVETLERLTFSPHRGIKGGIQLKAE